MLKKKIILNYRINRGIKYLNTYIKNNGNLSLLNINDYSITNDIQISNLLDLNEINMQKIKQISYKNYNMGEGIASSLVSLLTDTDPFPLKRNSRLLVKKLLNYVIK